MKTWLFAVAALLAPACAAASSAIPQVGPDGLDLVCVTGEASSAAYRWDASAKQYRPATQAPDALRAFESALVLHLEADSGVIRLPAFLLTGDYTGGFEGWWTLEGVAQEPGSIRSTYRLSGTRRPEILVTRADGHFRLTDGDRVHTGHCVAVTGRAESGL